MLQHIRARCDGERSWALPTQIILCSSQTLSHISINSMIIIIASLDSIFPLLVLYPLARHYLYHYSDVMSTFWISTVQLRLAIWFASSL